MFDAENSKWVTVLLHIQKSRVQISAHFPENPFVIYYKINIL